MLQRALAFALTLMTAGVWLSSETARAQSRQGQSPWLRAESQHFEIHYLAGLAPELDRVVRSAERAYGRISAHLNFVLATRVPLVMFAPSGAMTREEVAAYATSDQVAPPQPHRSRIVLPLRDDDAELDPLIVHELTHLLVSKNILPARGGDGGVPWWVQEGIASYMVGLV